MKKLLFLLFLSFGLQAQENDSQENKAILQASKLYDLALSQGSAYHWLHDLCKDIGARPGGSPQYAAAVHYTSMVLDSLGVDSLWTQELQVPYWKRGSLCRAQIINSPTLGNHQLSVAALGFSAATPLPLGLSAEVIEVAGTHALEQMSTKEIKGKIVFLNKPMNPLKINTFHAYGAAVGQRSAGPRMASEKGAVGVIVRSMTVKKDDIPHSGVTVFGEATPIPAVAIGLESAALLSQLLSKESVQLNLALDCEHLGMQKSYNVIAEIKGSTYPDKIILVGGHLDSWDIGEGAHDDGAGCVQAMEVLNLFKRAGIRPKHTIRCVLFTNEETGLQGAKHYAKMARQNGEKHFAAIESDAGGFTPKGFRMDADSSIANQSFRKVMKWRNILGTFGLYDIRPGGSAADISRLKSHGAVLFGYRPDSQRYFDLHHAQTDVFEHVHKRELELGAASMALLCYLIDEFGLN